MTSIVLVTGYRRMGKDYIVKHGFNNYRLFVNPKRLNTPIPSLTKLRTMKFATPLRSLLSPDGYFVPEGINTGEYEYRKDDPDFLPYDATIRKFFIEISRATRLVDQNFFAKRLEMDLNDTPTVITDWRYPNEYNYLNQHNKVVTIRVHREYDHHGKKMDIPNEEDDSEHSLDTFKTDFVAVPIKYSSENCEGLVRRFPWSKSYILI